ncbi:MAG: PepSY domain-containing protein [Cocleimonas sp.]|nr:PepSY domain-containing protein [Cocleimonas sp.]
MGRRLILSSFISLLLFGYSNSFADDDDHDEAYELLRSGEILPLEKILEITRKKIPGRILEVELEHEDKQLIYELEVLDPKGIVWEIKVDAVTGAILEKEQD